MKETTLGRSTVSYGAETIALMYVGSVCSFPVGGILHISTEIFREIIYLYNLITRSISKGSPPSTLEWLVAGCLHCGFANYFQGGAGGSVWQVEGPHMSLVFTSQARRT